MKRTVNHKNRAGYTLIEILVAVTLMLILMLAVTQLFSRIGGAISDTQATLGITANLRGAKVRLEKDLKMLTADPSLIPPVKFGSNQGYFCIIEGMGAPYGNDLLLERTKKFTNIEIKDVAYDPDSSDNVYDTTIGDMDDIIMFTAKAPEGESFKGKCGGLGVIESKFAEIIYFVRGNTLYRRVLLIVPQNMLIQALGKERDYIEGWSGFYNDFDVSVHFVRENNEDGSVTYKIEANTLDDLSKRENRFAHNDQVNTIGIHKFDPIYYLRMPTLSECSAQNWNPVRSFENNFRFNITDPLNPQTVPDLTYIGEAAVGDGAVSSMLPTVDADGNALPFIDYWQQPLPWSEIDQITGNLLAFPGRRQAEDVILTNVISFDVQVWDPQPNPQNRNYKYNDNRVQGPNRYVHLGEQQDFNLDNNQNPFPTLLQSFGLYEWKNGKGMLPCVYDTWTDFYEIGQAGMNQIDESGNGVVDSFDEWVYPPPYPVGLRGIKVTIRVFDPQSRNIREMTVIQNFTK
ncbi:MAG: PilW family protein [Thermoguttaceae bacterium]